MPITHLRPPAPCDHDRPVLFLAGPIQGAAPWQNDAADIVAAQGESDLIIANPRRHVFTSEGFIYAQQVDWESLWLRRAAQGPLGGSVLFWLPLAAEHVEGRSYAQTTRFELAEWVALASASLARPPVIGIEPGFSGERYIRHRTQGTDIEIFDNLKQTVLRARDKALEAPALKPA